MIYERTFQKFRFSYYFVILGVVYQGKWINTRNGFTVYKVWSSMDYFCVRYNEKLVNMKLFPTGKRVWSERM